jgi:hypothetical protein
MYSMSNQATLDYERARFNLRKQEEGETIASFSIMTSKF